MDKPVFIAGPCVIESAELLDTVAQELVCINQKYGIDIIFKASFDKANRTSLKSFRGPGLEKGLEMLADIKLRYGLRILTDIHEAWQADPVGKVADVIQIPAFLCRQTDLLVAAARTGQGGQYQEGTVSLWPRHALSAPEVCREWSYGGVAYRAWKLLRLQQPRRGFPQYPRYARTVSHGSHGLHPQRAASECGRWQDYGDRRFVPAMAMAAKAFGATGYFFEVHPDPDRGKSDAANMLELDKLDELIGKLLA